MVRSEVFHFPAASSNMDNMKKQQNNYRLNMETPDRI